MSMEHVMFCCFLSVHGCRLRIIQLIAQSSKTQRRRRILHRLHVQVSAEFLDVTPCLFCGTNDAIRVWVSRSFLVCRIVFLSRGKSEGELSPIMCNDTPLPTTYILSLDFMIGLGLDALAASLGWYSLEKSVLCTSA